jgi:octaprenyl-diphosphate synthase
MKATMDSTNLISAKQAGVASMSIPSLSRPDAGNEVSSLDAYRHVFVDSTFSIRNELAAVDACLTKELDHPEPRLASILRYVSEFGGKRLRPCLTLLSAQAAGHITDDTIRLATVVELVHTATLLHDDILDNASLRRHKPCVHVQWTVPMSILAGDWIFAQAYGLANRGASTLPGRWIADAAKQVCEGEILQGMSIKNFHIGESEYIRLVENKTGALCAVSCSLGAWSGGGDESSCFRLQQFGLKLGAAFQIMDDWLDVWGASEHAGKTLGTDLLSFKPTLPSIRTLDRLPVDTRISLVDRLNAGDQTAATELRGLMELSDASAYTIRFAENLIDEAIDCLHDLPGSIARESLRVLARMAAHRNK